MAIDFEALKAKIEQEIAEDTQEKSNNSGYPLVYSGENGKLTVKLLFNEKMQAVQRKVIRHQGSKVPCLKQYGEDCPICDAIKRVEEVKTEKCGVYGKYGVKTRGICFAQIIDHEATYFKNANDPKKKDIVLLMYPQQVYKDLNNLIISSYENDHIADHLGYNEGIPFIIQRTQDSPKSFPKFTTLIYPYGKVKSYESEEEFENHVSQLPNLADMLYPSLPNDEIRQNAKQTAEAIIQEYLSNDIVNPGDGAKNVAEENAILADKKEESVEKIQEAVEELNTESQIAVEESLDEDKPECFKNGHDDSSQKCLLCPFEPDCCM